MISVVFKSHKFDCNRKSTNNHEFSVIFLVRLCCAIKVFFFINNSNMTFNYNINDICPFNNFLEQNLHKITFEHIKAEIA